jgi:nucleotide-binding universal stress UspA family protein
MGVIVVGIDYSEGSKAALRFALAEAKLRHATLRAVHSAHSDYIGAPGIEGFYPLTGGDLSDVLKAAEAALEAIVTDVASDERDVEIECRVVDASPGAALVEESREAELLVVGSRGHGGFAGLLLGSVGQQCAQHAACPVVIIPHRRAN